jgi:hypothetical protein
LLGLAHAKDDTFLPRKRRTHKKETSWNTQRSAIRVSWFRNSVKQATAKLVDRAVASGDIRLDFDPLDLLRALAGVANIGLGPDGERAAKPTS